MVSSSTYDGIGKNASGGNIRIAVKTTDLKPWSAISFTRSKTDILISICLSLGSFFSVGSKLDKRVLFNWALKS